jgi:hypothetical protein
MMARAKSPSRMLTKMRLVRRICGCRRSPGDTGGAGNLIDKPQCVNGLRVSRKMLKPAFWSPAEPAWDFKVTPFPFQRLFLGRRLAGDPVPVPASSVHSPSDASCSAPTSGRAQNASCSSFLERFLFWLSEARRGEAPAGCRRVYTHRFTHEFPRRAEFRGTRRGLSASLQAEPLP